MQRRRWGLFPERLDRHIANRHIAKELGIEWIGQDTMYK